MHVFTSMMNYWHKILWNNNYSICTSSSSDCLRVDLHHQRDKRRPRFANHIINTAKSNCYIFIFFSISASLLPSSGQGRIVRSSIKCANGQIPWDPGTYFAKLVEVMQFYWKWVELLTVTLNVKHYIFQRPYMDNACYVTTWPCRMYPLEGIYDYHLVGLK